MDYMNKLMYFVNPENEKIFPETKKNMKYDETHIYETYVQSCACQLEVDEVEEDDVRSDAGVVKPFQVLQPSCL